MLSGESLLVFAPGPWDDMWRSRHQIMSRLARRNTVLWVEPRPTLRQVLRRRPGVATALLPAVRHIGEGLHVFGGPATLPSTGPGPLKRLANQRYHGALTAAMTRLGMAQPILWLYLPEMVAIIGEYGERLVVYHVVDEYSEYSGVPRDYVQHIRNCEAQMLRRADVVIATAPALLESKSRISSHVHLVPNAVDYEGFQKILATSSPPATLAALPRPLIGYVGAISDKVDFELLLQIAAGRPDWSLVLVGKTGGFSGPDTARMAKLRSMANVHIYDAVPVDDVPRYMAACDVCLLPYKINERTRNISALKLYEYLACGKPVIASNVAAVQEGAGAVTVAGSDDFVAAIAAALHDDPAAAQRRRDVAAGNTWQQRVESISAIIETALAGKRGE